MQSGNVLTLKNGVNGPGMKEAMKLGAKLGCPRNTSRELVNCLRLIDAKILTLNSHGLVFRISIETKSPTPELDNCLPDDPLKLMEAGLMNPVPSILGITSGEGMRIATDNYKYGKRRSIFSTRELELHETLSNCIKNYEDLFLRRHHYLKLITSSKPTYNCYCTNSGQYIQRENI